MESTDVRWLVDQVLGSVANSHGAEQRNQRGTWYYEFSELYLDYVQKFSKQYRPIRWLPLAVPRFELDKDRFLDWWDRECIDILRVGTDIAEPWPKEQHPLGQSSSWYNPSYKGCHIYHHSPETFCTNTNMPWTKKLKSDTMFNPLIEQIMDTLPIDDLWSVHIWESVRDIYPHRDHNYYWDMPTEMRIMLFDDNDPVTEKTLYVADVDHKDINYIDLPNDTNTFIWSNGSQLHGSVYHGKRKQLIALNCAYDLKKYKNLLDRSISKYQNQLNYKLEL